MKGACVPLSDPPEAMLFPGAATVPPPASPSPSGETPFLRGRLQATPEPRSAQPGPPLRPPEPEWIEASVPPLTPGVETSVFRPPAIDSGVLPLEARPAAGGSRCPAKPHLVRFSFRPPEPLTGHALLRLAAACAHVLLPLPVTPVFGGLAGGRACSAEPVVEVSSPALARREPPVCVPAVGLAGLGALRSAEWARPEPAKFATDAGEGLEFFRPDRDPAVRARSLPSRSGNLPAAAAIGLTALIRPGGGTLPHQESIIPPVAGWTGWDDSAAGRMDRARMPAFREVERQAWPPQAAVGPTAAGVVPIPFPGLEGADCVPALQAAGVRSQGFGAAEPAMPGTGFRIGRRRRVPAAATRALPPGALARAPLPGSPWLPPVLPCEDGLPDIVAFVPPDVSAAVPAPASRGARRRCSLARETLESHPLEFRPPKRLFAGVFVPQWRSFPFRPRLSFGPPPPAASGRPDGRGSRTPASARPDNARWSVRSA